MKTGRTGLTFLVLFTLLLSQCTRPSSPVLSIDPGYSPAGVSLSALMETGISEKEAYQRENLVLRFSFLGDIMAHDVNFSRPPYSRIYEGIEEVLQNDDLTFGNLEFPVDPDKPMSNYPAFNVHPAYVEAALEAGIEVFSMANNHITDQGAGSLLKTIGQLESIQNEKGFYFSGISEDPELYFQPLTIPWGGYTIGFLAVTEFLNSYTGKEYVYLLNYRVEETRTRFLKYLETISENYDIFVLSFHGGTEYAGEPSEEKKAFFYDVLLSGVDILWAHHPHVLQPYKLYTVQGAQKLIIYSAGNLISGQTWRLDPENPDPARMHTGDSAVFRVTLELGDSGVAVVEVNPLPVSNYRHPEYGMIIRPTEELSIGEDIPEIWKSYYKERLEELEAGVLKK